MCVYKVYVHNAKVINHIDDPFPQMCNNIFLVNSLFTWNIWTQYKVNLEWST